MEQNATTFPLSFFFFKWSFQVNHQPAPAMVSGGDEEAQSQLISFAGLIIGAYKVNACDIMYALHGGVLNRLGES